jgi:uncharacterized membrane protein YfcA
LGHLSITTAALLFVAAAIGGAINSVAGGGSFVAFPALLLAGVPAVAANATNTIALWPGSAASALAYRRELREIRREIVPMGAASLIGGLAGSALLLRTSNQTFVLLIPWLLLFAALLFTFGKTLSQTLARGGQASLTTAVIVQGVISVYGGYFGGGMGIMMLAVLSLLGMADVHRMNALKTALATLVNGVAVVAFIWARAIVWAPGLVMVAGGIVGGYAGAALARRTDPKHVRRLVLVVAWGMTAYFFGRVYVTRLLPRHPIRRSDAQMIHDSGGATDLGGERRPDCRQIFVPPHYEPITGEERSHRVGRERRPQRLAEPPHHSADNAKYERGRVVGHDEPAARGRPALDHGKGRLDVRKREVHDDAFPNPGRRERRIMAGAGESLVEAVALEVYRDETNLTGGLRERSRAPALVSLRVGMIDLEHNHFA